MPEPRVPAMILAGGLSRRMGGGDKGLLDLHGRPLLAHVAARLAPQAAPVALNANGDPARFAALGLPVVPDPVPGHPGPLAGLLAALLWARGLGAGLVLTVPGDAPFLPADLARRLGAAGAPAVAASGGRAHPVAGLWPVGIEGAVRAALDAGRLRLGDLAREVGARVVDVPVPPGGPDPFHNVNTPTDLDRARGLN